MKEKFKRFKNEKIVINVRSQKQYDDFMKMCEKQGLKWISEDLPTTKNHYNKYKENTCIDLNNLSRLSYDDINFYKNKCYKIITYKDFIKEGNIKYKIGDRVKVVDAGELYSAYEEFIKENAPQLLNKWESNRVLSDGGNYEVKAVGKHKVALNRELAIIEQNNKVYIVDFKGLELVKQFKKSNLKDNHIVKLQNGDYVVMKQLCVVNDITNSLEHKRYKDWQINEVYEFGELLWKREEQILDDKEKNWLNHFIKSTNIKVKYIVKYKSVFHNNLREYLKIDYNINGNRESITFPSFKEDTMYRGMEVDKEYTVKELGL